MRVSSNIQFMDITSHHGSVIDMWRSESHSAGLQTSKNTQEMNKSHKHKLYEDGLREEDAAESRSWIRTSQLAQMFSLQRVVLAQPSVPLLYQNMWR